MSRPRQQSFPRALSLAAAAVVLVLVLAAAQPSAAQTDAARGAVSELRERRRAALLVSRAQTVDARDPARAALDTYWKALAGSPPRPHAAAHRAVARQLNKYILRHRSLTAVETVAEADFVIIFNVLRARRSFMPDEPYVYGKLFVIARPLVAGAPPRVVWESEEDDDSVEDALGDFLKALKALRGEK